WHRGEELMTDENGELEVPAEDAEVPSTPGGVVREVLGCVVGLAVVFGFLMLAAWGYRAIFGPSGPIPVEAGEVKVLELHGGGGGEHAGRKCKVYAEWVAVEADGTVVMI